MIRSTEGVLQSKLKLVSSRTAKMLRMALYGPFRGLADAFPEASRPSLGFAVDVMESEVELFGPMG